MVDKTQLVQRTQRDGIALIIINHPPVNAASQAVRAGLKDEIARANGDETVSAIVLACDGRTFVAGADIREFGKTPQAPLLIEVCAAIEASDKPIVAAIHGAALGGGFELALAAHARIATPDAKFGLPEVKLGLVPGAGGTQRLPRLIGVPAALALISSGRQVGAEEALSLGAVDRIADGSLREAARELARELIGKPIRRSSTLPTPPFDPEAARTQFAKIVAKARGQVAPGEAANLVLASAALTFAEGMAREREVFLRLMQTEQAEALRYVFFAEREAGKIAGLEGAAPRPVSRVGIAGAGTMGSGIAVAFMDAGFNVTVVEPTETGARAGLERIEGLYKRALGSGRIDQSNFDARLAALKISSEIGAFADCDLIVEAVFDDLDVKQALFETLSKVVREDAILATNTSYLDPEKIAAAASGRGRILGMHFFAPANVMRLLEVVRLRDTQPDVLATAMALGRRLRKIPVMAGAGEGFIGNRIYAVYRKQCEFMLEEGAFPHEIDAAMERFGLHMGPFRAFDLSGLDIAWALRNRLAPTRDPRVRYVEIPDRICELGRLGQKTGAGWYRYVKGSPEIDPEVTAIVEEASRLKGLTRRAIGEVEIRMRLVAAMTNEAARCLEERIAARASDIDLVFINGYGWPAWIGGPLFQASAIGLDRIFAEVEAMKRRDGPGFEPAKSLVIAARDGVDLDAGVARLNKSILQSN